MSEYAYIVRLKAGGWAVHVGPNWDSNHKDLFEAALRLVEIEEKREQAGETDAD